MHCHRSRDRLPRCCFLAAAIVATTACAAGTPAAAPVRAAARSSYAGYAWLTGATDIDGRRIGPAPAGVHATVVVVFASWCEYCQRELALVGNLFSADPRVRVIGLNAYEDWHRVSDAERMRAYLARHAPWLRVVRATRGTLRLFGGVPNIPTAFVFDRHGRMVAAFRRNRRPLPDAGELRAAVAAAVPAARGEATTERR